MADRLPPHDLVGQARISDQHAIRAAGRGAAGEADEHVDVEDRLAPAPTAPDLVQPQLLAGTFDEVLRAIRGRGLQEVELALGVERAAEQVRGEPLHLDRRAVLRKAVDRGLRVAPDVDRLVEVVAPDQDEVVPDQDVAALKRERELRRRHGVRGLGDQVDDDLVAVAGEGERLDEIGQRSLGGHVLDDDAGVLRPDREVQEAGRGDELDLAARVPGGERLRLRGRARMRHERHARVRRQLGQQVLVGGALRLARIPQHQVPDRPMCRGDQARPRQPGCRGARQLERLRRVEAVVPAQVSARRARRERTRERRSGAGCHAFSPPGSATELDGGPAAFVADPPSLSGRRDLNSGPHRPERCALPGCATPRRSAQS